MNFFPPDSKDGTTNLQLQQWGNYLILPLQGVFMKHELKNIKPKNGSCYIINIGNQETGGTHWVALIIINSTSTIYFDSYGVIPIPEVFKFVKHKNLTYSRQIIQHLKSYYCGQFCLLFLYFMYSRNFNYSKFLDLFHPSDTKKNDLLLKKYFKKI
jgi:hypothetical protein